MSPPSGAAIFLDLEITNHSNKAINNIRAFCNFYVYTQTGEFSYGNSYGRNGMNLLWNTDLWAMDITYSSRPSGYPSVTLRSGETKTVSLFLANAPSSDEFSIEEYIDNFYNRVESDFYISWIQHTGLFGGQWGNAFGITQWESFSSEWFSEDSHVINKPNPTNAVKIDIEPFQR